MQNSKAADPVKVFAQTGAGIEPGSRSKHYKPYAHRAASFTALLVILLALIGLIEHGYRVLPREDWNPALPFQTESLNRRWVSPDARFPTTFFPTAAQHASLLDLPPKFGDEAESNTKDMDPQSTEALNAVLSRRMALLVHPRPETYLNTIIQESKFTAKLNVRAVGSRTIQPSATAQVENAQVENAQVENAQGTDTRPRTSTKSDVLPSITDPAEGSGLQTPGAIESNGSMGDTVGVGSMRTATAAAESPAASDQSDPNRPNRGLIPFTGGRYTMAKYAPTLIAVAVRIAVGWLYANTKMMQPFHSLAKENGAVAKEFFDTCYMSPNDTFDPFVALSGRRWMMFCITILYQAVNLLAPFASELFEISPWCYIQDDAMYCGPEMRIHHAVGRVLEGLLGFSAVMTIIVWWMHHRAKSGIYQDPSTIASLAALLHNPEVLANFRRLDAKLSKGEMVRVLSDRRYKLGWYRDHEKTKKYGIILANSRLDSEVRDCDHKAPVQSPLDQSMGHKAPARKRQFSLRVARDVILGSVTTGILILIIFYNKNSDLDNSFEQFMDSAKFGPRFMMTIVGIIIYGEWKRIEREVTILEPYRTLAHGRSKPERTILLSRNLSPFLTLVTSLYRCSFFVSFIAAISCLAEVLIIILGGIPFSHGTLFKAYLVSTYLSIAILSLMLLGMVALYLRPRGPSLPHMPDTIGAVWSYLCGAGLLEDMADMSTLNERTRDRLVRDSGHKYTLEERRNMDGTTRWTIDYDSEGSSLL
ncbi:MAG: hypothetical protein M1816_004598 [Peltula sp. TS41687]|nr:MAG: hypothetical protein M1816_004598 [Peltula sp. TS41687]